MIEKAGLTVGLETDLGPHEPEARTGEYANLYNYRLT